MRRNLSRGAQRELRVKTGRAIPTVLKFYRRETFLKRSASTTRWVRVRRLGEN
jgi:hypothetical protein